MTATETHKRRTTRAFQAPYLDDEGETGLHHWTECGHALPEEDTTDDWGETTCYNCLKKRGR